MKLYHGTSDGFLDDNIIKYGIISRSLSGNNNFCSTNVSSHPDLVYLTNDCASAFLYACISATVNDHDSPKILAIDLEDLDKSKLRADENLISLEETGGFIVSHDIRNEQVSRVINDHRWELSLEKVKKCAYIDSIQSFSVGSTEGDNPFSFPSVCLLDKKSDRADAIKILISQFKYLSDLNRLAKYDEAKKQWFILTDFLYSENKTSYTGYYHVPMKTS